MNIIESEDADFARGIWVLWDDTIVDMSILSSTDQILTLVVYASPQRDLRDELWVYLRKLGNLIKSPWLIVGDYNQVLLSEDKRGG